MSPPPPHFLAGRRCQHLVYQMSCDEYDQLSERADGACELCGQVATALYIDHDHSVGNGSDGVRGLVCPKCNAHLRRVDAGERPADQACRRYLSNAWYKAKPPGDLHSLTTEDASGDVRRWWFRVPSHTWAPAAAKARKDGLRLPIVLTEFLRGFASLTATWSDYVKACEAEGTKPGDDLRRHIQRKIQVWQRQQAKD